MCRVHATRVLGGPPTLHGQSDVFSFGVVALQVTTQDPPSVGLVIREGQPEAERRAADLSRLPADHPMWPLILQCLQDNPHSTAEVQRGTYCFTSSSSELASAAHYAPALPACLCASDVSLLWALLMCVPVSH